MGWAGAILSALISIIIGAAAINVGARLLIDSSTGFRRALITAILGSLAWGLFSFLEFIPVLGILLMLVVWVAVINWQYPGGWGTAIGIGVLAWIVAVAVVYLIATVTNLGLEVFGIPGI